jgi:ppGpp synthetase/RelA/SpoT-type nucleotidyltranferase
MAPEEKKPEEWGKAYARERHTYSAYTAALEGLLTQLLAQAGVPSVQIEGRTKAVDNFVAKIRRKEEKYADPLAEVTDLSGIRLVLYYLDDIDRVGKIIEEQFEVDRANSVDKRALLDPDRFGYLSVHYVVRPAEARKLLPEWSDFGDISAEIQVRTVLQHAWGAISRKLAYASVREAPRDLQRNLNRLSALLELADDEFAAIRATREQIEEQYDRELERGNLDLEVDESSLDSYIRETGLEDRVSRLAREAGSPRRREDADYLREKRQEGMSDLLGVLRFLGVDRISQLDQRLDGLWKDIPDFMSAVNERYGGHAGRPISDLPLNWLVLVLLWSAEAAPEIFDEFRYADELIDAITSTYQAGSG